MVSVSEQDRDAYVDSTDEFDLKSKSRLAETTFDLRKVITNSEELRDKVETVEKARHDNIGFQPLEDDQSYTKETAGVEMSTPQGEQLILGICLMTSLCLTISISPT